MTQQYGKIDSALVEHHHFRSLSATAKLLCMFLRVTPRANAIGCFYYPLSAIADDLDIPFEGASEGLLELEKRRFAVYCKTTRWVFIPKLLTHFPVRGRNSAKHALAVLATVPREFSFSDELVSVFEANHDWQDEKMAPALDAEWEGIKRGFVGAFEGASKGDPLSISLSGSRSETETAALFSVESDRAQAVPLPDQVQRVFDHWRSTCEHPDAELTPDRRKLIRGALEHYPLDTLLRAIDGCKATPWNQGENDTGQKHDDIGLILRNAGNIERFAASATAPPRALRRVTERGELYRIDGAEVWLPRNDECNDREILRLCQVYGVHTRGKNRRDTHTALRSKLERAEQGRGAA